MRRSSSAAHEIVSLAREHLAESLSVYYAPEIPPKKEAGARRAHALHLPEGEPILVLCDSTVFGGADDGFVITPARLCWKNLLEHARQIAWEELDPATIATLPDGVGVAGGKVLLDEATARGAAAALRELAARFGGPRADPYRGEASIEGASGALLSVTRLVAVVRRQLGEIDGVYYAPTIPPRKLRQARETHRAHLAADEEIAALYDDTLFGSAEEGFVLTTARLCWKNIAEESATLPWASIEPPTIVVDQNRIQLGDRTLDVVMHAPLAPRVAALFAMLAREARERA